MKQKIKLFIHDNFFEAFADLPKQIQKKTREFMRKFREDPTSSAINYEKISTFTDQSLRTVRIDQKYRAIVKAPDKGDGYTLLYVDNHDEAMDWAKNKVFEFNPTTQAYQLYEKPHQTISEVQSSEKDKVVEAKQPNSLGESFADDQLLKLGTPNAFLDYVKSLRSLEDLEGLQGQIPADNYEYLYYLIEGIPFEDIESDIEKGFATSSEELSSNAQRSVFVLTDDSQIEEYLSGDVEKWKLFLHPSQRSLAFGDFNGPTKVLGGAGTGKTVCAIHRLRYLSSNLGIYDKPILFTTYTKSLSKYLTDTISNLNLDSSRYVISNFDHLVFHLAKETGVIEKDSGLIFSSQEEKIWLDVLKVIPSSRDQLFLSEEYNNVILKHECNSVEEYLKAPRTGRSVRIGRKDKLEIWDQYLEFKKRKGNMFSKNELCNLLSDHFSKCDSKPYSHIICDELQDFSAIELRLMRLLVEEKKNDLFFVGDPYQNIYKTRINFTEVGINVRGRRSRKLNVNYRTTEEIKKYAVKTISMIDKDDFDGQKYDPKGYVSLIHGEAPSYEIFNNFSEESEHVLSKIMEVKKHFSDGEICIAARSKSYLDRIKSVLASNKIEFEDLGKEDTSGQLISLSTFHNLKGHEFKVVILVGVSNNSVPMTQFPAYDYFDDVQKDDYDKTERSLLYVAISRAVHTLYISGVGEKCSYLN